MPMLQSRMSFSLQVFSKIDYGFLSITYLLAVHDPFPRTISWYPKTWRNLALKTFARASWLNMISGRLGTPETGFHVDTCSGHDHMDMGMVIKAAGMGVENCGESCSTAKFLVVFYKGLQDILDTGEHQ